MLVPPSIPSNVEEALPHLRLRVQDRSDVESNRNDVILTGTLNEEDLGRFYIPYYTLGEVLAVTLAYDCPEQILQINSTQLSKWMTSLESVFPTAHVNSCAGDVAFTVLEDCVYVAESDQGYCPTTLVNHSL